MALHLLRRLLRRAPSRDEGIIDRVRRAKLTYLSTAALRDLYDAVRALETAGLPGILVEAGCARGGSAIVLAAAKAPERPLRVYDVFGMIPPPSERDGEDVHRRYEVIRAGAASGIGGDRYYGYEPALDDRVRSTFAEFGLPVQENGVELVKGLYEDTLRGDEPVALAHIDCDWYDSVITCLSRLAPRLAPHGVLVIDDYEHWSGCRRAVDDYFADKRDRFAFVHKARLHVVPRG